MDEKLLRERLLQRIALSGLSQKELAKATGDPHRSVQNWLARTQIPASFIVRFLTVIPTNPAWLLTGEGNPEPLPESQAVRFVSEVKRLLADMAPTLPYHPSQHEPKARRLDIGVEGQEAGEVAEGTGSTSAK